MTVTENGPHAAARAADLPNVSGEVTAPPPEPTAGTEPTDARACQLPNCPGIIPPDAHPRRIYCDDHDGRSPERRKVRRDWMREHGGAPRDEPPRIGFDVGKTPSKGEHAKELDAVEARAKQITKGLAILVMLGPPDELRRADAGDLLTHSDTWAATVRELAVHEEWLRKLGAGGDMSERAAAWAAFAVATGAMLTPILLRHEVIKGGMAKVLQSVLDSDALTAA